MRQTNAKTKKNTTSKCKNQGGAKKWKKQNKQTSKTTDNRLCYPVRKSWGNFKMQNKQTRATRDLSPNKKIYQNLVLLQVRNATKNKRKYQTKEIKQTNKQNEEINKLQQT